MKTDPLTGLPEDLTSYLKDPPQSHSNIDPVSGIPEDLMSLIIYSFIPTSHRHLTLSSLNYRYQVECVFRKELWLPVYGSMGSSVHKYSMEFIYSGSGTEYLGLPIFNVKCKREDPNYKSTFIYLDEDVMVNTDWFSKLDLSIEIDEKRPVFCKIKHGIPLDLGNFSLFSGMYLNSDKTNDTFREFLSDKFCFHGAHVTIQKEQDSPAFSVFFTTDTTFGPTHFNYQYVLCIPVSMNQQVKDNFNTRVNGSKWPRTTITNLKKMLNKKVYAVPKPDPHSKLGHLRWRLSFSVLEIELARSLTDIQRRCYKVLKTIVKLEINKEIPDEQKYPSYYIKTIFFWFCEKTSISSWKAEHLGRYWLKLFDNKIESLDKKNLPHYFIPSYNLLEEKRPSVILLWKERLKQIRQKPLQAFANFWSKYVICDDNERWGDTVYPLIQIFIRLSSNIATNLNSMIFCSHLKIETARYLLAIYSLEDFLVFVKHFQQMKPLQKESYVEFKEILLWSYYYQFFRFMSDVQSKDNDTPKNYFHWWIAMAEVVHSIALKHPSHINKMFSRKTAESFYLISCSIQNEPNISIAKYVKYANYLRVEKRYEEAVHTLMIVCQRITPYTRHQRPWGLYCHFNRVTSNVLDKALRLGLVFQHDTSHYPRFSAYHFLTCCYVQAGVLAEVCTPENIHLALHNIPCFLVAVKQILYGYQLLLADRLPAAFHCFLTLSEKELVEEKIRPYNITFLTMFFIFSRFYTKSVLLA